MRSSCFWFLFFFILFINCKGKQATPKIKIINNVPESFTMYKTSEMANLMRIMLAKNKALGQQIIKGKDIGSFNSDFFKIHTATLTDSTDLDASFTVFANHFLQMQQEVFLVTKKERKKQFNKVIDACISCHQDRCSGPIPRIRKLIIK